MYYYVGAKGASQDAICSRKLISSYIHMVKASICDKLKSPFICHCFCLFMQYYFNNFSSEFLFARENQKTQLTCSFLLDIKPDRLIVRHMLCFSQQVVKHL